MLKPDALQNIKLSVTSSGAGDKVEVRWGAKNEDGKLSDQTCRIEGSELVLPYVAWKASRGVTKSEHTLRVIATLLGSGSPRAANPSPNPNPNEVAPGPLP